MSVITIERKILEKNDEVASHNRDLFLRHGIFAINIVSSPGAGKTTLLECTLKELGGKINAAVIEGDVQTDLDAQRVSALGVPTVQIVTKGGCHLEAPLVREALASLPLDGVQLLIIENVGNLVCPANYDLGEAVKVVVASVTEGDDKPLKYPTMFRNAAVMIINKIDLLPYVNSSVEALKRNALSINPSLKFFETSCIKGTGIAEWSEWLVRNSSQKI